MSFDALLLQTMSNHSENPMYSQNIAVGHKKCTFENGLITLNHNNSFETKLIPETLIFNISNDLSNTLDRLNTLKQIIYSLQLHFSIGTTDILKIPLSVLWGLKEPEIIGDKLYLSIPFSLFFGEIHMCGILQQDVNFRIVRNTGSVEYITGYHLLFKTFLTHPNEERRYTDVSNNIIQQLSSIHVKVDMENPLTQSNEFRIRTNMLRGLVKGFFIEVSNINDLYEIQFYMNGTTRIDYDMYMIKHMCTIINNNIIYMPFNSDITYDTINQNSYTGSINIDRIDNSFLNLKFSSVKNQVYIYALTNNFYNQRNGSGFITFLYPLQNITQDFSYHTLTPIEDLLRPYRNSMFYHEILQDGPEFEMHLNDAYTDASGNYISQVLNRLIEDEERNTCPISQLQIQQGERYMLCAGCLNCYNEMDLIQWFQNQNGHNRVPSCPTCREPWRDFNVYINSNI